MNKNFDDANEHPQAVTPGQQSAASTSGRSWIALTWAVVAAFGTYFCMYAFRKPFTVATYDVELVGQWDFKTVAVSAQVIGYTLSKFIGIGLLAELAPSKRCGFIVLLILIAEFALIGFASVPQPYNIAFLFLNGLPLGMVFGLVLGFLEGRTKTEVLAAALCTSFILADGATKTVGKYLLSLNVDQFWMPAATGGLFLLPLLIFVAMLGRISPPSRQDQNARSIRSTITSSERRHFLRSFAGGLIPLMMLFLLVTILRSVRSDFAPEIWSSLGTTTTPDLFTRSEFWVGIIVTLFNGAAVLIVDNQRAFRFALCLCGIGAIVVVMATLGQQSGQVAAYPFMILLGVGLYLPYVAIHTTVFERMIAITREKSNLVFVMYVADAIGYLGYVAVMLSRNSFQSNGDFMSWFRPLCYGVGSISLICLILAWRYFNAHKRASASANEQREKIDPTPIQSVV